jgi:hypothetical protein
VGEAVGSDLLQRQQMGDIHGFHGRFIAQDAWRGPATGAPDMVARAGVVSTSRRRPPTRGAYE